MNPGRMVVDGRFELLEQLGSGGMGTVWRAHDLALHREVALKEVRPSGLEQMDSDRAGMLRERVLREARALARLHHPNVVAIHHIVDTSMTPHPWIVMELVRGRSLQERLAHGPLAPVEAAHVGRGILAALRTAHAAGICHRDVKPANVLLRHDGSPVLTDFGIAALHDAPGLTVSGDVVGSPEYIAPERLRGQEGNPASDLWSLGMLLYVAVEARHPMRRDTPIATLAAVLNGHVPPPRQAGPLTPVLTALLNPDPATRPNAAQLDWMLAQAAGQPMPGYQPGPSGPPGPPGSRPMPGYSTMPNTIRRPRRLRAVTIAGVAALGGILATVLVVLPKVQNGLGSPTTSTISPPATAPESTTPETTATSAKPTPQDTPAGSLLTPKGIKAVIPLLEKASGGTEFTGLTVYKDYAIAQARVRGKKNLYDTYTYRNGQVTRDTGGTLSPDDAEVKLSSFNWDALPALWRTADNRLGIPKATSRYLIVHGSWTFADDQPVLLAYLSDEYGGAYLAADVKGKVLTLMPRDE
ncbi:serine/threonine-protein kinase [Nonomuraea cavernae]|uniref:serine/threonine-protein kinase n=1 Tax=Nonomuraea cavernae TaxID=2045107 RepID=UPI0034092EBC